MKNKTLPQASEATITIQDVTDRTLRVINGQYAKGYNEIRLTRNDVSRNVASTTGVLYYTLTAGNSNYSIGKFSNKNRS